MKWLFLFSLLGISLTNLSAQHTTELHLTPFLKPPSAANKTLGFAKSSNTVWTSTDSVWIRNVLDQSQWNKIGVHKIGEHNGLIVWLESHIFDTLSVPLRTWLENSFESYWDGPLLHSPTQANSGIKEHLSNLIGEFPNINDDNLTHIVVTDIVDGFPASNQFVVGFFDPVNLFEHPFSNHRDMIYLDLYPGLIQDDTLHEQRFFSTFAHELQHLVFANYDRNFEELTFINEGISEIFEIACGFPPRSDFSFRNNIKRDHWSWNYADPIPDYERASSYFHYLVEQNGWRILQNIVQSPSKGVAGFTNQYPGGHQKATSDFRNWIMAIWASASPTSNQFSFVDPQRLNAPTPVMTKLVGNESIIKLNANNWTFDVLRIEGKDNIRIHEPSNSRMEFQLLRSENRAPFNFTFSEGLMHNNPYSDPNSALLFSFGNDTDSLVVDQNVFVSSDPLWNEISIQSDDGFADSFLGNARYLSFKSGLKSVGWILHDTFEQPPHKLGINAVWESELAISDFERDTPRSFRLELSTFFNGIESSQFDSIFTKPPRDGQFGMELVDLPYLRLWPNQIDSLKFTVSQSDSNIFAIGLEETEGEMLGFLEYENQPQLTFFGTENHLNIDLTRFAPSLTVNYFEKAKLPEQSVSIVQDISFVDTVVVAKLDQSFKVMSFSVLLPNGSWFAPSKIELGEIYIPAMIGADYQFHIEASDTLYGKSYTQQMSWKMPLNSSIVVKSLYPHPVVNSTHIEIFSLEEDSVQIKLFDMLGRLVLNFGNHTFKTGDNILTLTIPSISSGTYILQFIGEKDNKFSTKKVTILE